jgi:hypothetical protein
MGHNSHIDASVIEAKQCRPHKGEDGENTQDKEAGYNVKQSSDGKMKTTFGFKAHMNVDEDGFVSSVMTTAGNVHDSQCLEDLLTGAEEAVYAGLPDKSVSRLISAVLHTAKLPCASIRVALTEYSSITLFSNKVISLVHGQIRAAIDGYETL